MAKNKIYRNIYHQTDAIRRGEVFDCPGCYYRRNLSHTGNKNKGTRACHYLLDTGEPRGCTARECYENKIHFIPDKRRISNND